jgi:hypothetical protein
MRKYVGFAEDSVTARDIPSLSQTAYHSVNPRAQQQINGTPKHQHGISDAVVVKKAMSRDRGNS